MRMARDGWGKRGQSFVDYVVLISAVAMAVALVGGFAHKAFVAQAQDIETKGILF